MTDGEVEPEEADHAPVLNQSSRKNGYISAKKPDEQSPLSQKPGSNAGTDREADPTDPGSSAGIAHSIMNNPAVGNDDAT